MNMESNIHTNRFFEAENASGRLLHTGSRSSKFDAGKNEGEASIGIFWF
jgi:hypothetical protein